MADELAMTEQDRACVNCKNLVTKWSLMSMLGLLFGDTSEFYRCSRNGKRTFTNPITGKVKTTIRTQSCSTQRGDNDYCGEKGDYWEPSDNWAARKPNLFKLLKVIK
jgi:hypothetical protein